MARPSWTPETATDAQRKALKAVDAAAAKAAAVKQKAETDILAAVQTAHELGIPYTFLADRLGRGRATLYRQLPSAKEETP